MRIAGYAKINFVLDLLGKRPDGYHELSMVMQSVSLADYITLEITNDQKILVESNKDITVKPEENIAYKAADKYLKKFSSQQGVKIKIEKNIPMAAGLAGGSADCAAVLKGLNQLLKKATETELVEIANQLGSDTAFCLEGGTCLAQGRGEVLTKLPAMPLMYGLILKPPFPVSTGAVYSSVPKNHQGQASTKLTQNYQENIVNITNLSRNLKNDLYQISRIVAPAIDDFLEIIKQTSPAAYQMSGSGPSIFAFYPNQEQRDGALRELSAHEVYPMETIHVGTKIIHN